MNNSNEQINKNTRKHRYIIPTIIFACIAIGITIFIITNFHESLTVTGSENTITSIDAISCTSNLGTINGFFNTKDAIATNQEIKVTFKNDLIADIMYILEAKYDSERTANLKNAEFQTAYNLYLEKYGISLNDIASTFAYDDTNAKVSLYATNKAFNNASATLFLLDSDNYNLKQLQAIYADKGFNCVHKQ